MTNEDINLSVSEFVDLVNQSLSYSFQGISVTGELANMRVSKNRWLYFDLKDQSSTVKFFGTIYNLPGPLEDGMIIKVKGMPKLHNLYGFSVTVQKISLAGEGSIKRAAELLKAQLQKEGLFDPARKRPLPYPPKTIGLVASKQSAAYADFVKIMNARWGGVEMKLIDVQVQGEPAPSLVVGAIEQFNAAAVVPDVLVVIRGGGSAEDLAAFNTEQVTRAVSASRVPTIVAIGHETDISLAELAADKRASTPSNAAELLVPDKSHVLQNLHKSSTFLDNLISRQIDLTKTELSQVAEFFDQTISTKLDTLKNLNKSRSDLLQALSPSSIIERGYAIVRSGGSVVSSIADLKTSDIIDINLSDGNAEAIIKSVRKKS
jgi:exodeoxyribonuclease VII large subunit